MDTKYYEVAGHQFQVTGEEKDLALMKNYEPFALAPARVRPASVFALTIAEGAPVDYTEELRQSEECEEIVCGYAQRGAKRLPVFEFRWTDQTAGWLVCSPDYAQGQLTLTGHTRQMAIDNALMVLFALATARKNTALFHASTVSHDGVAYLFLGKSGTGKSTHARLWLQYVDGCMLVNDDNPVVRVADDGRATVYGSPWSGKTPCYKNVSFPLGGIVMLSQAPYNKIRRLDGLEAYAVLVPSISGKRWDAAIADGLHATENALACHVPAWHLACRPDEEAARLCETTISNSTFPPF